MLESARLLSDVSSMSDSMSVRVEIDDMLDSEDQSLLSFCDGGVGFVTTFATAELRDTLDLDDFSTASLFALDGSDSTSCLCWSFAREQDFSGDWTDLVRIGLRSCVLSILYVLESNCLDLRSFRASRSSS